MTIDKEIDVRRDGCAGRLTLNRPDQLNAVTLEQIRAIRSALDGWSDDPAVELVIMDSVGDRAFAAGGDVRALYDSRPGGDAEDPAYHQNFWREEYELNALIARYPKPYVVIMDGITMGGGVGISAHGSHRIVTERSRIAMPETAIGLVPDVGGTFLLSRAPGETGTYLGLTGQAMNAADAIFTGFADHYIPAQQARTLAVRLCEEGVAGLDSCIDAVAEIPRDPGLEVRQDLIDRTFGFASVEQIVATLEEETHGETPDAQWARDVLAALAPRSPLCQKSFLAAVRADARLARLEDALQLEFRLTTRLFECGEFIEGIRALIIDKDKAPRWQPARLDDLSSADIAAMLAPLPDGEELILTAMNGGSD